MIWASELNGWGARYNPYAAMYGFMIMPGDEITMLKEQYPGNYTLVEAINYERLMIESYLQFDDPAEEILFILKYM
jgi:hypothetical protein